MENKHPPKKRKLSGIICLTLGATIFGGTYCISQGYFNNNDYDTASSALLYSSRGFDGVAGSPAPVNLASMEASSPPNLDAVRYVKSAVSARSKSMQESTPNVAALTVVSEPVIAPPSNNVVIEDAQKELEQNVVKKVSEDPISTFSIDTDDGSYKLFSNQVSYGRKLNPDAIRTEEFINAFNYDYPKPSDFEVPFATHIEVLDSPWSDNKIIKIGVQGVDVDFDSLPPVNLVFLVDVSGSMSREMPKIQMGLKSLVNKLRPEDKVSLVTYAGSTRTVLKATEVSDKDDILDAIDELNAGGGTYGEAGIKLAYKEAERGFVDGGVNRILLMSDGDFNVGVSGHHELKQLITEKRQDGITFSTIGLSDDSNFRDGTMEMMANHGNGNYTFISNVEDAREVFADRFASTLVNIAKDVKTQIEFNPDAVKEYRMIGYENRSLKNEDFANDNVDSGEIPSGLSATFLYEVTLNDQRGLHPESRYADKADAPKSEVTSDEIAFLKMRYKEPGGSKSKLLEFPITTDMYSETPSDNATFALSVAGFTQLAKHSNYVGGDYDYNTVISTLESLDLDYKKGKLLSEIKTFIELDDISAGHSQRNDRIGF